MIKEKPILFSTEMVKAILEGRKTVTRRIIKPQPIIDASGAWSWRFARWFGDSMVPVFGHDMYNQAYSKPDQILWVRETWCRLSSNQGFSDNTFYYKASMSWEQEIYFNNQSLKWKPSIFMPREACRIFLKVKSVRAEKLQAITFEDVEKEGVQDITPFYWICPWADLWNSINLKRGFPWDADPWVWRVEFELLDESIALINNFK